MGVSLHTATLSFPHPQNTVPGLHLASTNKIKDNQTTRACSNSAFEPLSHFGGLSLRKSPNQPLQTPRPLQGTTGEATTNQSHWNPQVPFGDASTVVCRGKTPPRASPLFQPLAKTNVKSF